MTDNSRMHHYNRFTEIESKTSKTNLSRREIHSRYHHGRPRFAMQLLLSQREG
jgi:hypothetical protein